MRDWEKELIVKEISRVSKQGATELELTYDYIVELFKHYDVEEFTDHFYDQDCPNYECDKECCEDCEIYNTYRGSKEQLSYNNWVDVWAPGIWGWSQETANILAREYLDDILDDEDIEYRLWTFDQDDKRWIYYYNRDRVSDNWFLFRRKE